MKFITYQNPGKNPVTIDLESMESIAENFGCTEMKVTMKSGKVHEIKDHDAIAKIKKFIQENTYVPKKKKKKKEEKSKKIEHSMEQTMKV